MGEMDGDPTHKGSSWPAKMDKDLSRRQRFSINNVKQPEANSWAQEG